MTTQTTKEKSMKNKKQSRYKVTSDKRRIEWASNRGCFAIEIKGSTFELMDEERRNLFDALASLVMDAVHHAPYQAAPHISRIKVTT